MDSVEQMAREALDDYHNGRTKEITTESLLNDAERDLATARERIAQLEAVGRQILALDDAPNHYAIEFYDEMRPLIEQLRAALDAGAGREGS